MRNIFIAGSENTIAGILGGKYKKKLPINNANQIFKTSYWLCVPREIWGHTSNICSFNLEW